MATTAGKRRESTSKPRAFIAAHSQTASAPEAPATNPIPVLTTQEGSTTIAGASQDIKSMDVSAVGPGPHKDPHWEIYGLLDDY